MLRFMVSQASIERSSEIRFSTSRGSKVGTAMPGMGTPSGPHRRRNISNGSCGGLSSGMGAALFQSKEFAHFGFAGKGVAVAKVDQRAAERLLEQEVAREIRARAVEGAGGPQYEAHGPRQLMDEARGDALQRLRGGDEKHLDRAQLDVRLGEALGRDQLDRAVDALQALDVDHERVEEDAVERMAGDLGERWVRIGSRAGLIDRL